MRHRLGLLVALIVLAGGCRGLAIAPGTDPSDPPDPGPGPGPGPGPTPTGECSDEHTTLQAEVGGFLERTCVHSGCHGPTGPQRPYLSQASLPDLTPEIRTDILSRLDPDDPSDLMPPVREANAPADIALVRSWVEAGAPSNCIVLPEQPAVAPNSLDQDDLFTCSDPSVGASPARVHRVNSPEWIHGVNGVLTQRALSAVPFNGSSGPYTTFAADESIDPATLAVYLDVLASVHGLIGFSHVYWWGQVPERYGNDLNCMTRASAGDPLPDADCRDAFIDAAFRFSTYARDPSDEERAALRAFLDRELEEEGSRDDRDATLANVFDASWVMFGALHRSYLGGSDGQLTDDETIIGVASALTTYLPTEIDNQRTPRPELAWVAEVREAQESGPLDETALRSWITRVFDPEQGYVGGQSTRDELYRDDLQRDYTQNNRVPGVARRGEYWLAPRIARFFREYFDYGGVAGVAKDDPAATSRFDFIQDLERPVQFEESNINAGYDLAAVGGQTLAIEGVPNLVDQLDDAIARMVIETEASGGDVFSALLTGRTFRVAPTPQRAANIDRSLTCNPLRSCYTRPGDPRPADCCADGSDCVLYSIEDDGTPVGHCGSNYQRSYFHLQRPYNVADAIYEDQSRYPDGAAGSELYDLYLSDPAQSEAWVTMPEDERAGVLTHPTWLAAHGGNAENDASPILRGHWVREHLFCEDVAGLHLVQLSAQLPVGDDSSARSRLQAAMDGDARCNNGACHGRMNSLGLPFETYNHAGYLRETDHGAAPDGSSRITNWPGRSDVEVNDAVELANELAGDAYARRCFVRHVFRYFMARYETPNDACTLGEMEAAFAGGSFFGMLEALYQSDAFLSRTTEAP
ncbi:MAG: DUF1588 domain-containing protein [Sandaracinaceae bacterium]